jgi:hypothetical protein
VCPSARLWPQPELRYKLETRAKKSIHAKTQRQAKGAKKRTEFPFAPRRLGASCFDSFTASHAVGYYYLPKREQPALRSEPSAATGRGAAGAGRLACGRACGKGRKPLLDPFPAALGAHRRLLVAGQDQFFEDVSAVTTGIFEDGHGERAHSLRLMSQLSCSDFPAGEARRRAQVKRETPGMRGSTRNQTTRKRTNNK